MFRTPLPGPEGRPAGEAVHTKAGAGRGTAIPKDNGKKRKIGISTIIEANFKMYFEIPSIDRGIQMAITKALSDVYDWVGSETSYGFRANR